MNNEPNKLENLKNKSSHGGKRSGAGRKKGSKNKATLEQAAIKKKFDQKVLRAAGRLFRSQMTLAEGVSFLYRIDKDSKGKDKKPVKVTSPEEIEEYLSGETDGSGYYYITTISPDNRAIDSMLDRVFGRATQHTTIGGGEKPLEVQSLLTPKQQKDIALGIADLVKKQLE